MTSQEIQDRLTDIRGEIVAKQQRLTEIPTEKARVLDDEKFLSRVEKEESELASAVDRLSKRLPLLAAEKETALRTEAAVRLRSIEKQWGEAAREVAGGSVAIRKALADLLALITRVNEAWGGYDTLGQEARYLSARYQLPKLSHPAVDLFALDELRRFAATATEVLQRRSPEALDWAQQIESLEEERREEAAKAEASRPLISVTDRSGEALAKAQREEYQRELQRYGGSRTPLRTERQGFTESR